MQLLDEIIQGVTEGKKPISDVLRLCLVLSYKLKNKSLKDWVEKELNGYDYAGDLPEYRSGTGISKGLFFGSFGSQVIDQPLSPHVLEPEHRHFAQEIRLVQPIAAYDTDKAENAIIEWPAQLVVMYQSKFIRGMALNRAYLEIPASMITSLIDTVKTKVLTFALEIQEKIPDLEQKTPNTIPTATVENIVQVIIYGGNNVIGDVKHFDARVVIPGDMKSLQDALTAIGFTEADVNDLENRLIEDRNSEIQPSSKDNLGSRTMSWIASAAKKLGGGAIKVGGQIAEEAIKAYVKTYLGI